MEEFRRIKTFSITFGSDIFSKHKKIMTDKFTCSAKSFLSTMFYVDYILPVWLSEPINLVDVIKKNIKQ